MNTTEEVDKEIIKDYMKYAIKNNIYFNEDEVSSKNLFKKCNQHRQHYLLYKNNYDRGTKIETKCYKKYFSSEICDGWYTNEKRCGCGVKWYWDEGDTDYSDLNVINIFDKIPTGNPERC